MSHLSIFFLNIFSHDLVVVTGFSSGPYLISQCKFWIFGFFTNKNIHTHAPYCSVEKTINMFDNMMLNTCDYDVTIS